MKKASITLFAIIGSVSAASAQQIATRTDLDNMLMNGIEYTEAFEAYNIGNGGADLMNSASLDSGTTINGQGPGLVDPFATYSVTPGGGGTLQWDGANYFGSPSEEILAGSQDLIITYSMSVQAMGVDIRQFAGFGDNFTANVFNGATLVGTFSGSLAGDGSSMFFGWENDGGITSVVLTDANNPWSPIIDNHSYGSLPAAPEPASMALLAFGGIALMRRRRR